MFARLISRISVIFAILLLSGCSAFGFIFERLDWFTLWRLDQMFDLSDKQEDLARPDIIAFQQWMREEGFPETIDRLEILQQLWEAEKQESAYRYLMSSIAHLKGRYLSAMQEGVVNFSMRLTPENAENYREYSNEKQEDWFDETTSLEILIEEETERLEKWLGHLRDGQVRIIEDWASLAENERQIRIDNHINWREAFLNAALNREPQVIRAWLNDLSIFWTPEYTVLRALNYQKRQELVFALIPTLSERQKLHASEYVEDWIEKLRDVLPED